MKQTISRKYATAQCKTNGTNGRLIKFNNEKELSIFVKELRLEITSLGKWPTNADHISILIGMITEGHAWKWIDSAQVFIEDFPSLDIISRNPEEFITQDNIRKYVVLDLYRVAEWNLRVESDSSLEANTYGCEWECS
ncbi:DgyrCDS9367 [Dimorphilus gyrociliatus]|uniref:DgyrCDS9367 n=1 Tax=Dimorphilus gyrociliatus TaxID=2664684 RepID=A0A7I8VWS9_9ANNE|nr:DgyrCDS9367 [Dimorphilus gyrociliatus]